jgi:hypothetical protein
MYVLASFEANKVKLTSLSCPVSFKILSNMIHCIYSVTCLRHAAIVETQKSVNTLRNNRGSGVFSVPCRVVPSSTAPHSLPCNRQRNNAMTVARISLTQINYIATVFGVSVQRRYPEGPRRYRVSFLRVSSKQ